MLLKKDRRYRDVFLLSAAVSFLIFLPFLIYDKGIFLFYGDYNVQQIPFYQTAVEAIRSGNIFYSFKTDLGSGFLPSYSFYLLGLFNGTIIYIEIRHRRYYKLRIFKTLY